MTWILVVDDDVDVNETMRMILEMSCHPTAGALNGKEALTIIEKADTSPNLIFLDLWMPVMDGITFLEHRKKDLKLKQIPTYLVSADAEIEKVCKRGDATGFLSKPVCLDDLMRVANKYTKH